MARPKKKPKLQERALHGFPAGAAVEVRSDDEGFLGAWYEATVLSHNRRRRRYRVVYATLVADDDPSPSLPLPLPLPIPLTEFVHAAHVRPRPPPRPPTPDPPFAPHHLVEAFHHDGWWAGVVFALVDAAPDRYVVSFPNSREVIEFAASEIRPRLEWVRGKWLPAQDLRDVEPIFAVGAKVEARRSLGWFSATVLKVIGTTNFLVEYDDSGVNCNGGLTKEILDALYVRPTVHDLHETKEFSVSAEVEVFREGGWLPGVVSNVLPGSTYAVKVNGEQMGEEMEFDDTLIRLRREWNGRQWIDSSAEGKEIGKRRANRAKKSVAGTSSSSPISLSTSSDEDGEVMHEPYSDNAGDAESAYPSERLNRGNSIENGLHELNRLSSLGDSETPLLEQESAGPFAIPLLEYYSSSVVAANHSVIPPCEKTPTNRTESTESPRGSSLGELTRERNLPGENGNAKTLINGESCHDEWCARSEDLSKDCDASREEVNHEAQNLLPIVNSTEFTGDSVPISSFIWGKRKRNTRTVQRHKKRKKTHHVMKPRKRSRSPKKKINCLLNSKESGELKHSEEARDQVTERQHRIEEIKMWNVDLFSDVPNLSLPLRHQNEDVQGCNVGSMRRVDEQADVLQEGRPAPQTEYLNEGNTPIDCPCMQVSRAVQRLPTMRVESSVVQKPGNGVDGALRVCSRNCMQKERHSDESLSDGFLIANERALVNPPTCATAPDKVPLSFVKSSSLWKSIEMMEIFHRIPQKPHFVPLEQYCSEFREGMAIGLMVSFANLVSSVGKLRIDDGIELFEKKLNILAPLEAHGFDVSCVRSRLNALLRIKDALVECEKEKEVLQEKISQREDDINQFDAITDAMNAAISEVERNLAVFCKRRDSVVTQRRNISSYIASLKLDASKVESSHLSAEQQFNNALAEPW